MLEDEQCRHGPTHCSNKEALVDAEEGDNVVDAVSSTLADHLGVRIKLCHLILHVAMVGCHSSSVEIFLRIGRPLNSLQIKQCKCANEPNGNYNVLL